MAALASSERLSRCWDTVGTLLGHSEIPNPHTPHNASVHLLSTSKELFHLFGIRNDPAKIQFNGSAIWRPLAPPFSSSTEGTGVAFWKPPIHTTPLRESVAERGVTFTGAQMALDSKVS